MSDEPRPRSSRLVVVLAALLAAGVAAGAVLVWVPRGDPGRDVPVRTPLRFGEGTEPRLAALRDRLVAGLASTAQPDGGWPGRPRFEKDPWARRETTALAFAGLSAAKRMGATGPALEAAIAGARKILLAPPRATRGATPSRSSRVVGVSATVLGFALGGDPADLPRLDLGAADIAREADAGPLPESWPRAIASRAALAIVEMGRGAALGADPLRIVQVKGLAAKPDCDDPRVVEAFAQAVRAGAAGTPWAASVAKACLDMRSEWADSQTDLDAWTMRAFLAARVAGSGDRWFAAILPELEKAPDEAGVVQGDIYGDPTSRTAEVLLILHEGWGGSPPR